MMRSQRSTTALVAIVAAGLIGSGGSLVLVSCSGANRGDSAAASEAKALTAKGAAGNDLLSNASTDLQAMFDAAGKPREMGAGKSGAVVFGGGAMSAGMAAPKGEPPAGAVAGEGAATGLSEAMGPPAPETGARAAADGGAAAPIEQRRAALVEDLAKLIREQAGPAGSRYAMGVQLALLAALGTDADAKRFELAAAELAPAEARALEALRLSFRAMVNESTSSAGADPEATARIVEDLSQRLAAEMGVLSLPEVALCERVEGFGRYVPFGRNVFTAGRAQEVVVYVEVAGFSQRPWSGNDQGAAARPAEAVGNGQYVTELGQEVALYSAVDGYQALYRPEQVVRDVARRVRRDFYLVQRIALPSTLAIGTYNMKVTLRDKSTGATAEKIVPIQIVEDTRRALAK